MPASGWWIIMRALGKAWRLPAVPAVKTGRIYLLVGDEFVVPGPRVVGTVERLAAVLHPDVFR